MTEYNPRDLEWQRRYEQNDTPWEKGTPAPALVAYLQQNAISGRILVPGCGRGHEARALAKQADCSVVGIDLAPTAIADATRLTAQAGLETRASFILGDFFHPPPAFAESFDWVVEHTCFCAIEPRQRPDYVLAVSSALRTGGKIFGIFYRNPKTETGPPFAVSKEELTQLFEPHFDLLEQWVPTVSFPGRESRELIRIMQKR